MKALIGFIATLGISLISTTAEAQNFYKEKISRDQILTIAAGPSFAYLDNGGQYQSWDFEVKPSVAISLTKKLTPLFELRTTTGIQWISSGGNPPTVLTDQWSFNGSSYTAKGNAYYFDLMPSVYLIPFSNHMHRSLINLYVGAGLGIMRVVTEQTKSFNIEERPINYNTMTGYLPVRAGLSFRLGSYSDLAGEGTMLMTFSDNLDGNMNSNRYADHLFQAQIVFRKFFIPKPRD